jgi:hypothetical protein
MLWSAYELSARRFPAGLLRHSFPARNAEWQVWERPEAASLKVARFGERHFCAFALVLAQIVDPAFRSLKLALLREDGRNIATGQTMPPQFVHEFTIGL